MSAAIGGELQAFANCLWYGVVLFLVYDGLRVLRGMFRHAVWLVGLEDLLFWIWAALYLFAHFFQDSYGAVRAYQLLGVGLGGALWEYGCGKIVTKKLIFLIRCLKSRILRCKILAGMRKRISQKSSKRAPVCKKTGKWCKKNGKIRDNKKIKKKKKISQDSSAGILSE